MSEVVVDASAVLAVLFGEPEADHVLRVIEASEGSDAVTLLAPEFLAFEVSNCVANARQKAVRLGIASPQDSLLGCPVERFAGLLRARIGLLGLTLEPFPLGAGFERTCELAERFSLTTYDAMYLVFAERRGAKLLSLDRALGAAASKLGIGL